MALSLPGPIQRFLRAPQTLYGARPQTQWVRGQADTSTPADLYRTLRAYYLNNGLYDKLAEMLRNEGIWREALKPFRNPAYRCVEFYPSHLWPGALPAALTIQTENAAIVEPIEQIWKWSNWAGNKQLAARHLAMFGDLFIKTASTDNRQRVYLQIIEPEYVTDFDADERGFLQWVRIDVPQSRRLRNGTSEWYWHTEVWDAPGDSFRVWEQRQSPQTPTEMLGDPVRTSTLSEFGIDFVPIVHAKFSDIGDQRGMSALVPALDKIDEANRQATRLSQMLFRHNKTTWALEANSVDASGRPLPAPHIPGMSETNDPNEDPSVLTMADESFVRLPGQSKLVPLVPNLNYDAALSVLQDHMRELEQDMPELVAYRLGQERDLSGRAVRLLLGPAIKRLEEARGNAESALVRAHEMALTLGVELGLFRELGGDFDSGAFEHAFETRDVLPSDDQEKSLTSQANATATKSYVEAGMPIELAVRETLGWTEEETRLFTVERTAAIKREQALVQDDQPEELDDDEPAT